MDHYRDSFIINPQEKWVMLDAVAGIVLSQKLLRLPVVEIGSSYGDVVKEKRKSSTILIDRARQADVDIYTCDIKKQCVTDYPKHKHFAMSSFDFMKEFATWDVKPALVFLDGCHDYDVVIEEVKFFLEVLATHGVILMHDTYPRKEKSLRHGACSDSYRVRQEVEGWRNIVDCFTWPYTAGSCGLTMIMKKEENRPYFRE